MRFIGQRVDCGRSTLLVLALAMAAGLTGPAPAQFGEAAGLTEIMSPWYLRRDLRIFTDHLQLDDGQQDILESLFWDYEDDQEAGKQQMIDKFTEIREELTDIQDRTEVMNRVFAPIFEREREWEALNEQFLASVKAILSDEQMARWPEFEKTLRREKLLPKGELSGESLNLLHILTEMDIDQPTMLMVESLRRDYINAIDEALRRRMAVSADARTQILESMQAERHERMLQTYKRLLDARLAVRTVNDQYIDAFASQLPAEVSDEFRQLALERAYARIYRPTTAQRIFEAAKNLDVDREVLDAIAALEQRYLGELAVINARLVGLIQQQEVDEREYRAIAYVMRDSGERPERPKNVSREEFKRRQDLDKRYMEELRNLLTLEQFKSLPGAARFLAPSERDPVNPAGSAARTIVPPKQGVKGNHLKGESDAGRSGPGAAGPQKKQKGKGR